MINNLIDKSNAQCHEIIISLNKSHMPVETYVGVSRMADYNYYFTYLLK
jgi:hypothetical protein